MKAISRGNSVGKIDKSKASLCVYLGVVCAKPTHSVPILFSQSKGQKLLGPWPNPTTSCLCKSSFMDHSHAHSFMHYLWLILCSNLELNSWDRHLGKMSIKYLLSGLHNLPVTLQEGTVLEMHLSLVLRCASQSLQVTSVHNGYLLKYPLGFPGGSDGKESACNAGDPRLIPGSGRCSGEGNGYPLQCSCLRIPWTEDPGGLQSMGLQTVRCDWVTNTLTFTSQYALRWWGL